MRMRPSDLSNPRTWRVLLACYWLTLLVLTHFPPAGLMSPATRHDKIAHLVAFAVLAAMLATTWQLSAGRLTPPQLGWAWLAVIVYAALDEWTQTFVGREASVGDWLADAAGAFVGLATFAWLRARFA